MGLQYYLPIASGRVWVSGVYSRIESDNIAELTPPANDGAVFEKSEYYDGNLFIGVSPAVQFGLSFQTTKQTYADDETTTNYRSELSSHFFF